MKLQITRGLIVWCVAFCLVAASGITVVSAWLTQKAMHKNERLSAAQIETIVAVGELPVTAALAIKQVRTALDGVPRAQLVASDLKESSHWIDRFPAPQDPGYLLLAGVDAQRKQSNVRLIRIADGKEMAAWNPDWEVIHQRVTDKLKIKKGSADAIRAQHPLLLEDGDIVAVHTIGMSRLSPCKSAPVWVLDESMHHSLERDNQGSLWGLSYLGNGFDDIPTMRDYALDDALTRVSFDGKILEHHSFTRIMRNNELQALVFASSGAHLNEDPLHLNQISVAAQTTAYWQKDDLLISARHISTVFLYRPSTGRIIWYKTGPWMSQHSAAFLGNHQISVFNNNVMGNNDTSNHFLSDSDVNQVMVYDFIDQKIEQPFSEALAKARPRTRYEGRSEMLEDGGLFVEASNQGRLLRFAKSGELIWSYINHYDANRVGLLSWSRYLTKEQAQAPLKAIADRGCLSAK